MRDHSETDIGDLDVRGQTDAMILPPQFQAEVQSRRDPERRLRLAVLEDAIRYFQRYAHSVDRRERALYEDAVDWIASPDRTEPYSFENVCAALCLDPDRLRQRLYRGRQAQEVATAGKPSRHLRAA